MRFVLSPQPESCINGMWDDAINEASSSKEFLNSIDNIITYLLEYPFLSDEGELGVRRISGCWPKQRSVWLEEAIKNNKGLNCFERCRVFLAWNINKFGFDVCKSNYQIVDIMFDKDQIGNLVTPRNLGEFRHVFPLTKTGRWVSLSKGERDFARQYEAEIVSLVNNQMSNTTTNDTPSHPIDHAIRNLGQIADILDNNQPFGYANINDFRDFLKQKYGPKEGIILEDSNHRPIQFIPLVDGKYANDAGFSQIISDALDPLIGKATKSAADQLKDKDGNIPVKHKIEIDPTLAAIGAGIILVLITRKK